MQFNAPIPFSGQPKFSEGSALASSRDGRNNSQLWKKVETIAKQNAAYGQSLKAVLHEVSKSRRRIVGGGVSANPSATYLIKDDLGSCLKCRSWDGTNEGATDVYIAKPWTLRKANVGDIQNGTTYAYSYSLGSPDTASYSGDITNTTVGTGDGSGSPNIPGNDVASIHYLTRTITPSSGAGETDSITPPYLFNAIIVAMSNPLGTETLDTKACSLIDMNLGGRAWAAQT